MEASLQGVNLLVVDDEPFNVDLLRFELEDRGANVLTAADGQEALELLEQTRDVDLALLDVMMPRMDGFELTRYLRARSRYDALPIILLTARSAMEDKRLGFHLEADDYVLKPFDIEDLLERILVQLRFRAAWFQARIAEEARARLAMVGALAHELSQPLAGASGFIQLLQVALARGECDLLPHLTRIKRSLVRGKELALHMSNLKSIEIEDYACGLEIVDIHNSSSDEAPPATFHKKATDAAIRLLDLGTNRLQVMQSQIKAMGYHEAKEGEKADLLLLSAGGDPERISAAVRAWKDEQTDVILPPVIALLASTKRCTACLEAGVEDQLVGNWQPEELQMRLEAKIRLHRLSLRGVYAGRLNSALDMSKDALPPFLETLQLCLDKVDMLSSTSTSVADLSAHAEDLLSRMDALTLILRQIQTRGHKSI
jgi:DNA-binding response OmpR family regulator